MEERWERDRAKWAAETEIEGIRQRKRSEILETESDTSYGEERLQSLQERQREKIADNEKEERFGILQEVINSAF